MRPLFVCFLFVATVIRATSLPCLAQKPVYDVTVTADGKSLDLNQGISASTKTVELTGQLTPESQQQYPQLKPVVLINKAVFNLIRDTRRVGFINWPQDGSIARLFKEARSGDRFVIQFEDVEVQTKQGTTQKVDGLKLIQISVKP
ncbi:hypothetical protein [Spirosoma agri]|uniref:Uncharacterized protein n=1 Tax=Spirosoma agri TaxID=1987381 RepID=A0A6M0ICD9_9BACT|nr:hypothetical protein [Spirosoma agri]NEU65910.1 hypothetical protein [Spirosoma agri]